MDSIAVLQHDRLLLATRRHELRRWRSAVPSCAWTCRDRRRLEASWWSSGCS